MKMLILNKEGEALMKLEQIKLAITHYNLGMNEDIIKNYEQSFNSFKQSL